MACLSKCQQNQSTSHYFLDLESLDCCSLFYFKVRPCCIFSVDVRASRSPHTSLRSQDKPRSRRRSLRLHSLQLFLTRGGWIDAGVNSIDPNVGNCIRSRLVGWDQGIAACRLTAGRCLIIIIFTIVYSFSITACPATRVAGVGQGFWAGTFPSCH